METLVKFHLLLVEADNFIILSLENAISASSHVLNVKEQPLLAHLVVLVLAFLPIHA